MHFEFYEIKIIFLVAYLLVYIGCCWECMIYETVFPNDNVEREGIPEWLMLVTIIKLIVIVKINILFMWNGLVFSVFRYQKKNNGQELSIIKNRV